MARLGSKPRERAQRGEGCTLLIADSDFRPSYSRSNNDKTIQ